MAATVKPQSAAELGLMAGFPPRADQRVTQANQFQAPYNRWSFQNETKLNPSAEVWRGDGPVASFEYAPRELDEIPFQAGTGARLTFGEMIELSYTDGIVVLQHGRIIYERYLNGMQPHTRHAWASCSKSATGTLGAMLAHEGCLAPDGLVADYLPELRSSAFGDATVRQVMDMTTALDFSDDYGSAEADTWRYNVAMGLAPRPAGYRGPETIYEFLATMRKDGNHGEAFAYVTPNTDVLAWLIKRALDESLSQALEERIWSRLGAERDAAWLVDATTAESAGSGLVSTTRDMARFGQMMLQRGQYQGEQIIPAAVIEDIEGGGDREAFTRGMGSVGPSYHHNWWITHNKYGAYYALGYGGQILYMAPAIELVVAKFSSYPSPAPGGEEFFLAFGGIRALAEELGGERIRAVHIDTLSCCDQDHAHSPDRSSDHGAQ